VANCTGDDRSKIRWVDWRKSRGLRPRHFTTAARHHDLQAVGRARIEGIRRRTLERPDHLRPQRRTRIAGRVFLLARLVMHFGKHEILLLRRLRRDRA
jgi:hypothetical protein